MPTPDRRQALITLGIGAGVAATGSLLLARKSPAKAAAAVRADLYNCEGCEAAFERPLASLDSVVQLASPDEPGERMMLSGQAFLPDGRPAADVIIYAHHTNAQGIYVSGVPATEWSNRYGRLRGWAKTDAAGNYRFDTIKPAPYPDRTLPAHVHLYIGEPGRRPYYIDDVVFDGEFHVTSDYRAKQEFRGGSGIIALQKSPAGLWLAKRDIKLERHA